MANCLLCGKKLNMGNRFLFARLCATCYKERKSDLKGLSRSLTLAKGKDVIATRSIFSSTLRLLIGIFSVDLAVLIGAVQGGWVLSLFFCFAALGVVRRDVLRGGDLLDRKRWDIFWVADVVVYWILYLPWVKFGVPLAQGIPFSIIMTDPLAKWGTPGPEMIKLTLAGYAFACLAGTISGFAWVATKDKASKSKVLDEMDVAKQQAESKNSSPTGDCST